MYYWFDEYEIKFPKEDRYMEQFIAFLDNRIAEGKREIEALAAAERRDDANFAKVKTNIYEVCRTVTGALGNRPGAGVKAVGAQLEKFRSIWGGALEKAKQHDDVHGVAVEEIKLKALEDVIAHFQEVKA